MATQHDFKKVTYFFHVFAILVISIANTFFPAREAQSVAREDWCSGWTCRKKITVAYTNAGATLTNFAVLVSVTDTNLRDTANGGHVTQSDGGDILFTNPQRTKLDHEIEKYVATNGQLIAWVKVDVLSSDVDTDIYMYYGGRDTNNQWNIANTWESSLMMVQHLAETSGSNHYDSTANANTGVVSGATMDATGQVDGADSFDGNDRVNCGNTTSLNPTNGFSISMWIKINDFPGGKNNGLVQHNSYVGCDLCFNGTQLYFVSVGDGGQISDAGHISGFVTGAWHHVVATWVNTSTNSSSRWFVRDGTPGTAANLAYKTPTQTSSLLFGRSSNGIWGSFYFNGIIDEFRLYDRELSLNEILTLYNNQKNPSGFYNIGIEEYLDRGTFITIF